MRKILFLILLITACNLKEQKLDGAYALVAAKYSDSTLSKEEIAKHKTIKTFKNGYWVAVTFSGNPKIIVESAIGGTYTLKDGKCIETVNFSSENNTIVGKTFSFEYKHKSSKYFRKGRSMSNDGEYNVEEEYDKIVLDTGLYDASLEGIWKSKWGEWYGVSNKDSDFMAFKIYAYPNFAWAQYKVKGKDFIGVGGGSYRYDGEKLVEHLEYISYNAIIPFNVEINVTKLSSTEIKQETTDGAGKEIWEKIQ